MCGLRGGVWQNWDCADLIKVGRIYLDLSEKSLSSWDMCGVLRAVSDFERRYIWEI